MLYTHGLQQICKNANTYSEICRFFGMEVSSGNIRLVKKLLVFFELDLPNYDRYASSRLRKYTSIDKICPTCGNTFTTRKVGCDVTTTCSYACANTHFKSGQDHPNWMGENAGGGVGYKRICFANHNKECVVKGCKETIAIDVHHMDEDHSNDSPENLIPLCKNHHFYWHYGKRHEIEESVYEYVDNWIKNFL